MRIAVAYDNGQIHEHFGHCDMVAIYDYNDEDLTQCEVSMVDCSDRNGHSAMAALMQEKQVEAVICGNIGSEAKSLLLSYGIVPVAGYCGPADMAADMLVSGQLPIIDGAGGCGGGCGGCGGGCCGSDEDDAGGCCGCH